MSWTDAFPYLTDDLISEYEEHATPDERAEFEEWFGIRKVMNRQAGKKHIVSITLFWKHVNADHPNMATPNRTRLLHSRRLGLVKRFDPYESYVEPLLNFGPELTKAHPEVCFRVHLAADLEFLAKDLIAAGYEIRLMKGSSIRYCPGGFWRFLALENRGKLVTVMDSDRIRFAPGEIARTKAMAESGLGLWRVPGYYNSEIRGTVRYRAASRRTFWRKERPAYPQVDRGLCLAYRPGEHAEHRGNSRLRANPLPRHGMARLWF